MASYWKNQITGAPAFVAPSGHNGIIVEAWVDVFETEPLTINCIIKTKDKTFTNISDFHYATKTTLLSKLDNEVISKLQEYITKMKSYDNDDDDNNQTSNSSCLFGDSDDF